MINLVIIFLNVYFIFCLNNYKNNIVFWGLNFLEWIKRYGKMNIIVLKWIFKNKVKIKYVYKF